MKKKVFEKALFIFRRDLRLDDNTGLLKALEQSNIVIPCFIFDPKQFSSTNKYKSFNALQFMVESLQNLEQQLKKAHARLYLFAGNPADIVKQLIRQEKIDAIFVNHDYTPYSKKRDIFIKKVCVPDQISFISSPDLLLHEPEAVLKDNGTPYTIFTPFFKKALRLNVQQPQANKHKNYYTKPIKSSASSSIYTKISPTTNPTIFTHGGRTQSLKLLKQLSLFRNYPKERDYPALARTTGLSVHLKFGTCSIRETYAAIRQTLGSTHPLIRQLYWRDFFTHIAYHFPRIFGHAFNKRFEHIPWHYDKKLFTLWCQGMTGFPLVDAGMRQLNVTGFMHNRVRMVVASFLTKDLHIDWRWGERYFATKLVDYDPSVNNGNWQWASSTGCDAQPYFRIFNPWIQQKKFDKNCMYIKQWIPELESLSPRAIHNWWKKQDQSVKYPTPIVDHMIESKKTKLAFAKTRK